MLHEHRPWLRENGAEVAAKIEVGLAQAERGQLIDGDEAFRNRARRRNLGT